MALSSSTSRDPLSSTSRLLQPEQIRADFTVSSLKQLLVNRHWQGVTVRNVIDKLVLQGSCAIETKYRLYEMSTACDGTVSITTTTKPVTNILQMLWQSITRVLSGKNELELSLNCATFGVAAAKERAINGAVYFADSQHRVLEGRYITILQNAQQRKTDETIAQEKSLITELSTLSGCIIDSMKVANNTERLNTLHAVHISLSDYGDNSLPFMLSAFVDGRFDDAHDRLLQIIVKRGEVLNSIPGVPKILECLEKQLSQAAGIN